MRSCRLCDSTARDEFSEEPQMVSMCWRFITGLLGNQHPGKRREEGRWNTYVEKSDYTVVGQRGVPKMS